jgi:hypothetical protein
MHNAPRLAIIGAGASGLMAASAAQRQGLICSVFDKARRAGGRMASRRSDWGDFNHGAPYISMPTEALMATDLRLRQALSHGFDTLMVSDISGEKHSALVPATSVNAIAQSWAQGLNCHFQHTLTELKRDDDEQTWWLKFSEQASWLGPFDHLLMTCPPVQALALLAPLANQKALRDSLEKIRHAPVWSVRWVPGELPTSAAENAVFLRDDLQAHGIALCLREDLRPHGIGAPRYTLHATAEWTAAHLEDSADVAATALMQAAAQALGLPASASYLEAHRWRYGYVSHPAGEDFLRGKDGLLYAGDACLGATVVAAMHSGLAAIDALCTELLPA